MKSTMPAVIGAELITTDDRSNTDAPGYMVVGFEVVHCSFQHDINLLKNLTPYAKYSSKLIVILKQ